MQQVNLVSQLQQDVTRRRSSPYAVPGSFVGGIKRNSLASPSSPSSPSSLTSSSKPTSPGAGTHASRRGSSNSGSHPRTLPSLAMGQAALVDEVDRLCIDPLGGHLAASDTPLLDGNEADQARDVENVIADLLDPDLTPTKARLKAMKQGLGGSNGAAVAPEDMPESPTRRLSASSAANIAPLGSLEQRIDEAVAAPASAVAAAVESAHPKTPSRNNSTHRQQHWQHTLLSPLSGPPDVSCIPLSPGSPPYRTRSDGSLVAIPPSPISRIHTRNPFTKSFS